MVKSKVCVFGEVLFDVFPNGNRVLGGAPFNLAWHLQAFGLNPLFISRVGQDAAGHEVREAMLDWKLNTAYLQTDFQHPTGRVNVHLEKGEPSYEIVPECAYDFISSEGFEAITCQVLCHGSLALRNKVSADALQCLKRGQPEKVFLDVNLRAPWWERAFVLSLVDAADWVKMNDHELITLSGEKGALETLAQNFRARHGLEVLVITCAEQGAMAVTANQALQRVLPSRKVRVVDTVGAGDAFSAVLVLGLIQGWPLPLAMERAQSFASCLVGRQGATVHDTTFYQPLIESWR